LKFANPNLSRPPPGHDSVKGVGKVEPDPKGFQTLDSDITVPMGKGLKYARETALIYNE